MSRGVWSGLILVGLVAVVGGCNKGGGVSVLPASGTVNLDGKPLEGATVTFLPAGGGSPASGLTDAQGAFQLNTAGASEAGATVGSYKVSVSKKAGGPVDAPQTQEEGMKKMQEQMAGGMANLGKKPPEQKEEVPSMYTSPDTSGLTAEIKEGAENKFTFDLKSSG